MKLMIWSLGSEVMFLFDTLIVFVFFLCRFHYRAGHHEQQDERGFTYQIWSVFTASGEGGLIKVRRVYFIV